MKFKTKISDITEHEYRELDVASYSLLKAIADEGPGVIADKVFKTGAALEFGQLVDILITRPEDKDEIFHTKAIEKPTASLLQLADSILMDALVNDEEFEDITYGQIELRIKELGLWSSMVDNAKLRAKYDNDLFYNYLKESIAAKGKIIVTPEILSAATKCANVLLYHDYTKEFFEETDDIEVIKQAKILYKFKGIQCKAMLDLIVIDHKNKIIKPFDIKTGAELPGDFQIPFYKYRYYLQVVAYLLAIQSIVEQSDEFRDYKIEPFRFMYVSKKLPDVPVIFEVPEKLLNSFVDGWDDNRGFMDLLLDYDYYTSNSIYHTERRVVEKKGKFTITLK